MADSTKLNKDGLNKVWLKVMELIQSLTGNVDRTKGTLQEQIDVKATSEDYGRVKVTNSSAVTDSIGLALAATEKNASIDGTLANQIDKLNSDTVKRNGSTGIVNPVSDVNNFYSGIGVFSSQIANIPTEDWWFIVSAGEGNTVTQTAYNLWNNVAPKTRYRAAGIWSEWTEIKFRDMLTDEIYSSVNGGRFSSDGNVFINFQGYSDWLTNILNKMNEDKRIHSLWSGLVTSGTQITYNCAISSYPSAKRLIFAFRNEEMNTTLSIEIPCYYWERETNFGSFNKEDDEYFVLLKIVPSNVLTDTGCKLTWDTGTRYPLKLEDILLEY